MTEILFYHLTETPLEGALPELLEKSLSRGWKVAVQTGSRERRDALDQILWTFSDDSFLPHGLEGEAHAAAQPILLTDTAANTNGATVRFLVDGAPPPHDLAAYQRAVFLFDGHDEAQTENARRMWRELKAAGHDAAYWRQTPDRRWERGG